MTKKIFKSVFLVSIVALLLSTVLIFGVLYEYTTNVSRGQLRTELKLAAQGVETEGTGYLSGLTASSLRDGLSADNLRITWIRQDGTVLYDSSTEDARDMENHLEREEVQEALQSGYGESERYSSTLMERLLYAAQRLDDGSVLRLSITQNSIWSIMLGMLQPIAIVLLLSIILSAVLSVRMSRRIVKPLNDLDLDHPLDNEGFDELSPLFRRLATQQNALTIQENHLEQQQEELDTILGNMQEGMILLRADNTIVSMNDAVDRILHITGHHINENLLEVSRDLDLAELVEEARKGQAGEKLLSFYDRDYQVSVTPVIQRKADVFTGKDSEKGDLTSDHSAEGYSEKQDPRRLNAGLTGSISGGNAVPTEETTAASVPASQVKGVTIVFFDVTEKEQAEQIRREFTANVSHELKTPLHSISGYAELLKSNMVRPGDVQPFAEKIYRESQRTIRMVEDIISLSHLDEGAEELGWEETDIDPLVAETVERLQQAAADKKVTLQYHGESARMLCKPSLITEIAANLCDNAIKYNKEGGSVNVQVRRAPAASTSPDVAENSAEQSAAPSHIILTVSDTGIGIPEKDQPRIFERFYRVDKSHSREIGGTGLGLSIVKHAVAIHHGTIHLDSHPGQGSTFTITLPTTQPENVSGGQVP